MSINNVTLVGRMTKDVDLRYTQNGTAVGNVTIACNRPFKNAQGEQEADFIRCTIWRKPAENLANYMKKGDRVGVTGRIETGSYEDKDGKTIFTTEVVAENVQFLQDKKETQGKQQAPTREQSNAQAIGEPLDISDDDLPF